VTEQSSFSHLRRLPVNVLKIDKSLVDGLGKTSESRTIVSAIVRMARSLGLETVAEGIERSDQASILHSLGCDMGQGFFFAKPQTPKDMKLLLLNDKPLGDSAPKPKARVAAKK